MANLIFSILSEYNGKGLAKGKKDVTQFEKNLKSLGKTLAATFAGYKLLQFGKSSVNAFIASEKAAGQLTATVENLGLAYQQPAITDYIKNLQLQYGIVDENLIPGFQKLLIATKDVSQAQSIFSTALNVSAGTGLDLTATSSALAKAYLGDNTALGKLGVGLTKAELKSGKFLDIQTKINAVFAGQAARAASGYVGDMQKVTAAVDQSKEAIGKGLLDALAALNNSDINTFTNNMVESAKKIGSAFAKVGDFIGLLNPNAAIKIDGKFVRRTDVMKQNVGGYSGVPDLKTAKLLLKARTDEYKIITAKNAVENKNVEELKKKFDLERIGLTQALNLATDEETKLRLRAQLAILDNNDAMAKKILAEMEAAEALRKLAEQAAAAGKSITEFALIQVRSLINRINAQIEAINTQFGMPKSPGTSVSGGITYPPLTTEFYSGQQDIRNPLAGTYYGETGRDPMPIEITINTASTNDRFSQLIAESLQVATRSGYSSVPNGFLV